MTAFRAIVGTAGHIDHGKSALVRALTGIETDRLPEEQARGISIELGFAHLDLPLLGRVGVVDVPGHERFVRRMLAGAHGFDLVLVVVAADDGVMPQTEEHFDIVHLLAVQRAIFVITKSDLADSARIEDVRGEIEILAAGTRFETAPVVAVSSRTGQGIDELRQCIDAVLGDIAPRAADGPLRIPVDRVFVMKGHGVVVTGTALAGSVGAGDEVILLPDRVAGAATTGGRRARVREVQVHGETVERATAGQRVAVNLSGLSRDDVVRGDTMAAPGAPPATLRMDARIEVRPAAGRALPSHLRVRVHHGTRETPARIVWLDGRREVAPRGSAYAQIALDEPLVAVSGDRFVIRDETASRTLGGGMVLLSHAPKHRRSRGDVAPALETLERGDDADRLLTVLRLAASPALAPAEAAAACGLPVSSVVQVAAADGRMDILPNAEKAEVLVASERLESFLSEARRVVTQFHAASPNLAGVDLEHLRGSLQPQLDPRCFRLFLDREFGAGRLCRDGNMVCASGHEASLAGGDRELAERVRKRVTEAGATPPSLKELAAQLDVDASTVLRVAGVLALQEDVVKVSSDLYFGREALEGIRGRLVEKLRQDGEISAAGFRDLIAASRKYCIPLLDWFDRSGLTIRVGDVRRLRRG